MDDDQNIVVTLLPEIPDHDQETKSMIREAILQIEDKLCSIEAYYTGTKTPSKRIMKALIKRAQYHMRRTRSMIMSQEK